MSSWSYWVVLVERFWELPKMETVHRVKVTSKERVKHSSILFLPSFIQS